MSERYSRQELFKPIGLVGQELIANARVLVVGCGALGASHVEMLARAGVGFLRIVDRDFVEITNLQRQSLFSESDAAERLPKAVAAANRLGEINSEITVEEIVADVNRSNVEKLIDGVDLVLDGTDNFQTRYLVNEACVKNKTPWIYGAAVSGYGATMTIIPGETPCLYCIFDAMPPPGSGPTCDTAGVVMPIIATISAIQVAEALKLIVNDRNALHGTLMQDDIWQNERRAITLDGPDPKCPVCGVGKFALLDGDGDEFSAVLCGRDAVQIVPQVSGDIDLARLAERLAPLGEVKANEYLVRFRNGANEITVFADGRAIIKGVEDIAAARTLYARYVGS
jgi:adenylyltransferase/sulfurtransferase